MTTIFASVIVSLSFQENLLPSKCALVLSRGPCNTYSSSLGIAGANIALLTSVSTSVRLSCPKGARPAGSAVVGHIPGPYTYSTWPKKSKGK